MKTTYSRAIIACASIATAATAVELTNEASVEEYKTCTDSWRYNYDYCYGADWRMPCDWEECAGIGWYFGKYWGDNDERGYEEWCETYDMYYYHVARNGWCPEVKAPS